MMLYERGLFALDEPISKHAPCFAKMKVAVGGQYPSIQTEDATTAITFQHLLTHTSGFTYGFIPDEFGLHALYESQGIQFTSLEAKGVVRKDTLETVCKRLAALPLLFQPGSKWSYGVSTDVVGYLVEILSGMPFEKFVKEQILDPLGMVDTDFYVPPEKRDRFAACYAFDQQGGLKINESGFATGGAYKLLNDMPAWYRLPAGLASGGGGLVSTITDYL
jgi:CubicO group peptidase (beta-lactamase class C family)